MYRLDIPGWMSEIELKIIENLGATFVPENGSMIEVGSFCGRSSWAWANSIPASATLHCIDTWEDMYDDDAWVHDLAEPTFEIFQKSMANLKNVTFFKGYSNIGLLEAPIKTHDLVFLDGNHNNPIFKMDLRLSLHVLRDGGILCGHDYNKPHWPDIAKEVNILANHLSIPINFYPYTSIWSMVIP